MAIARSQLIARLDAARVKLAAAGPRAADAWNDAVEELSTVAAGVDQEWLVDQIDDLGHLFSIPGIERAMTSRSLAARGLIAWDIEDTERPLPYYTLVEVRPKGGVQHGATALIELACGGGIGPWTWGYDAETGFAWFSDARRGATEAQTLEGLRAMAAELARLGLEFTPKAP